MINEIKELTDKLIALLVSISLQNEEFENKRKNLDEFDHKLRSREEDLRIREDNFKEVKEMVKNQEESNSKRAVEIGKKEEYIRSELSKLEKDKLFYEELETKEKDLENKEKLLDDKIIQAETIEKRIEELKRRELMIEKEKEVAR
ncbi:MAG: hypothetical protein NUV44_01055, partial [Candidatus Scalindua sp.]|nr:hypothetical protein [Candidatus Scalindua sp.]